MIHRETDIKLIKEQYPSLKAWSDTHAYEIYKKIEEHQLINEFLHEEERKYDQEVTLTSNYAYHLTPDLKWPKIKTFGLTPKTQGKLADHPGRIYLITDLDNSKDPEWYVEEAAFALLDTYPHKEKVKYMYLLQIDLNQLKDHKFFDDPNFLMGAAVWTYKNIPPSAIIVIDKIDTTE